MKILRTALIAVTAGALFEQIGMFLPWLLGPLLALLLLNQFTTMEFRWPNFLRIIGLLVLGVQMGSSFTRDSVLLMWVDLPYMAFMSVSVVAAALVLGILFRKMANESLATSLLGSMPGGLSQMVLISEEVKTANMTVVSMMQTIRIFLVVTTIPFLSTFISGRSASEIEETFLSFSPTHFGAAFVLGAFIYIGMKRVHFPAAEMLAPILVLAIVQTYTGEQLVSLPPLLINGAQVLVGAHLGLQMKDLREKMNVRLASAILVNNFLLMGFTAFLAYILVKLLPSYLFLDFFLSAAPGGMAEMTITALETGGDVALITSFQLFRLFFVLLIAAPAVAFIVKKLDAKTAD